MRKEIIGLFCCLSVVGAAFAAPTEVESYQFPNLVSEINTRIVAQLNTEGGLTDSMVTSAEIKDGEVANADISATAAIAHTKLAAVAPGYLLVGNASSQAVAVAVSGSITMGNDGAVDLAAESVDSDDYVDGSIDTAHIANDQITAALCGAIMQVNAGDIADTEAYTPDFAGQMLLETSNTDGTNNVWVAVGTGTNNWTALF